MNGRKRYELTAERLRQVLLYDPETGAFVWLVTLSNKGRSGEVAGRIDARGYVAIGIDNGLYKAHRLAWFYMTGEWPDDELDHRDTDKTNNRWLNLRKVTHAINSQNERKPRCNNSTGFLGVTFCKQTGRYRAQLTLAGKNMKIGRFDTPELAHAAYVAKKRELHEGNTL